jgi:hypothetical protein
VAASSILLTTFEQKRLAHGEGVVDEDDLIKRPVSWESIHKVNYVPIYLKFTWVILQKVFYLIDLSYPFNESYGSLILVGFLSCCLRLIYLLTEASIEFFSYLEQTIFLKELLLLLSHKLSSHAFLIVLLKHLWSICIF